MEVWMEILRPGKWNDIDFDASYLRDMAASYDPDVREAPLVVGHPQPFDEEKPAVGWVKKLELRPFGENPDQDDVSIWAYVSLSTEAEEMIRERKFPKRSVGISDYAPYNGIPYLRHVALLGSSNPAVSRLTEVEMADGFQDKEGVLCMAQVDGKSNDKGNIDLVWESQENEYWYSVKPAGKFKKDSFKSKDMTKGVRGIFAKYKEEYVTGGKSASSMVLQSLRFSIDDFDLARAKAWVKNYKGELSQMADDLNTVDSGDKTIALKAQVEKLLTEKKATEKKLDDEAKGREKAEKELNALALARLESEYEIALKELIDEGNGAPAYIELGVQKALVAMDAADVVVTLGDSQKKASAVIMSALKAVPKFLEHREVVGAKLSADDKGNTDFAGDDRFDTAMQGYKRDGKKVVGMDVKLLTDKLMKDDPALSALDATLKASKMVNAGGK